MVRWYLIASLLTALSSLLLGSYVFLRNKKRILNITYFLFNISIAIWSFGFAMTITAPDKTMGLFWVRFLNVGAILIPGLFLHFILALLEIDKKKRALLKFTYFIISIILVFNFTDLLIKDVAPKLFFNYYSVPGSLYPLFIAIFCSYVGYAFYLLFKEHKRSSGLRRNQLKYVLIASIIGFGGSMTLLLPVFNVNVPPLGYLFVSLYSIIVTYSIIQHRLMDINIVFKKGTVNTFLLTLLVIPSLLLIILFEKLLLGSINITFALVIFLFFLMGIYLSPRIKPQVEQVVDRIIFKDKYRYQKTLSNLSRVMVSILDLNILSQKIVDTITKEMEVEGASLFVLDEEKGYSYPITCTGLRCDEIKKISFSKDDPFWNWLKKERGDVVIKEELKGEEKFQSIIEAMEELQAEVSIPLILKGELVGILNLDRKITGDMYNREDLDLLKTLANQATIAIENAKMYEALRKNRIRMQRADRLASLGTLTAGLAHEIRNPLVAIKTFLQLLPEKFDDEEFRNYFLNVASGEVERISSLITELLDFSRPSEPQLKEENVNEIVDKMVMLLTTETKKKNLKITKQLAENLPLILVDKDQIKQVFLNIILNAVQATPENGAITIVTRSFEKNSDETILQIEIKDNGPGIPAQELEYIFSPFYTTKAQGSGLGLSISNLIVEEHHGYIEVESQVGSGTSFTVNLPLNAHLIEGKRQEATVQ